MYLLLQPIKQLTQRNSIFNLLLKEGEIKQLKVYKNLEKSTQWLPYIFQQSIAMKAILPTISHYFSFLHRRLLLQETGKITYMSLPHAFCFCHIFHSFCYTDGSVGGEVAVILKHGQNKAEFGQASNSPGVAWHGHYSKLHFLQHPICAWIKIW